MPLAKFHAYARLGRASDRMPWKGRLFGVGTDHPGFEVVDLHDGFTLALIEDGSIVLAEPSAALAQSDSAALARSDPPEPAAPEPPAPAAEPHAES